jgi:alcohol dehydrogenase (cytochrome c)
VGHYGPARGIANTQNPTPDVRRRHAALPALLLLACLPGAAAAADDPAPALPHLYASPEMLQSAEANSTDFLMANASYAQTRYYPNTQINTTNVAELKPAWTFHVDLTETLETTPIVVNGVMFVTTAFDHVYALDAKTGQKLWHC